MITTSEIMLRLLLGALVGGMIGFERQAHGRPAGFRTHILVCIASVLLMIVSEYYHYLASMDPGYVRADPGRIAAGAITGVGFLGAGVILKTGITIQGLTTAACIWVVSAIGLAIGSGLYLPGIVTSLITIITLLVLRNVERKMPKLSFRFLTINAGEAVDEERITSVLGKYGVTVSNIDYESCTGTKEAVFYITIAFNYRVSIKGLADELASLESVRRVCIKS